MQNFRKNVNGITLMALVVTIIILLILAGISIGMLSGDNGILGQAGNAKTQTDVVQEKEIIDIAVVGAMGKSKYGDIDETYFTNELEKNNATVTKSGSKYKVTFPSTRQYEVDQDGNVKEKKVNPNTLEISELNQNANTYFGLDVINYAETLPTELQDTKWQLFYAGALDIDETTANSLGLSEEDRKEERIYLISKDYVKNTLLPAKNGVTPILTNGSDYKAKFSESGPKGGVLPEYGSGSDLIIETKLQKLNSKYFSWLKTNNTNSTSGNVKAMVYMLDTNIWSLFATSNKGYAQYAIGGPTVELLFTAYNKYTEKTSYPTTYATNVSRKQGYQIKKTSDSTPENSIYEEMIASNAVPYSVSENNKASGYWLASPSDYDGTGPLYVMFVQDNGYVFRYMYNNADIGFRPLVLLDLSYTLEKTKDSNGKDALKIVEQ